MYAIRSKLTINAKRTIYMSLIYSHIIYCIPIWGNTWARHIRPVELAQKRAVRTIYNVPRYEHTHELFVTCKLLKLKFILMYFSSVLIFKFLHCNYVPNVFTPANNPYILRNLNHVTVPQTRLELVLKSVYYNAPNTWNNLHADLKSIININTFKRKLKEHILTLQTE